jgi:hypothetical protein
MGEEGVYMLHIFVGKTYGTYTYDIKEIGAQIERGAGTGREFLKQGNECK